MYLLNQSQGGEQLLKFRKAICVHNVLSAPNVLLNIFQTHRKELKIECLSKPKALEILLNNQIETKVSS